MSEIICALLVNPNSGAGIEPTSLDALRAALEAKRGQLVVTNSAQEAQDFIGKAVDEGFSRVIVSGGDDTVRDLLPALLESTCELAIVPRGTYNNLALALGLSQDPLEAVDLALTGQARPMDLGRAEGLLFTESAGVGYLAEAWSRAPQPEPTGFLRWATGFAAAGSALLDYEPLPLEVYLDGEKTKGSFWDVTVANASHFANNIAIAPKANLRDGYLDVTLWHGGTALEFLSSLPTLLGEEGPAKLPAVQTVQAKLIEIHSAVEIPLRVDNTVTHGTRFRIEVLAGALRVVSP